MTDLTRSDFLRGAGRLAAGAAAAIAVSRLDLTRLAYARAASSAPEESGAAGDGITDDTSAFESALRRGVSLRLTPGRSYRLTQLRLRKGDHIWCDPGAARIVGPANGKTIIVQGGGRLEGVTFAGGPEYHMQHDANYTAIDGLVLRNVTFAGGRIGLYTFGYGQLNRNVSLRGCVFDKVANPLIFEHLQDSEIVGARFSGADGTNVMFRTAQRCRVVGGSMDGGLTGVTFLGNISNNAFWTGAFEDNLVEGVTARNMREETISFDNNGTAEECLSRERAKVQAKSLAGGRYVIALSTPSGSWRGSSGAFDGAYMCVFSGRAAGAVCRAAHNDANRFLFAANAGGAAGMTEAVYRDLAVGDEVVIGLPFLNNAVHGNTLDVQTGPDKYAIGILFYGMCFGNVASGNEVRMKRARATDLAYGLQISSLSAVNGAKSFVSNGGDQRAAPCVGNLLKDNRLYGGDMVLNYNDFGARTTPYLSLLNRTEGNLISGGRRLVQRHADLSRNDQVTP